LLIAKKNGLDIPETLITTDKKSLMHFFNLYPSIITKDLRYPLSVEYGDYKLLSDGTFRVTLDMINNLNDTFSPTLVQNEINKEYEIRIFFFMKKLFTMAIFSQSDTQTEVDYRNYNSEKPNRNVPVVLPKEIEIKILKFVTELKLKTGSIDLIYSKCGKYYFLEINPMGQFDWVSKNCNYNIEKKIAQHLVKIENEN
jgi:glutathione synthase/RimK-type ligase-like ATP-grasp enzyme